MESWVPTPTSFQSSEARGYEAVRDRGQAILLEDRLEGMLMSDESKMLLKEEAALLIAKEVVTRLQSQHELVIVEGDTREFEFGWVFRVTSRRYLESKDQKDLVPGLGPLIIERDTGKATFVPTSIQESAAIESYGISYRQRQK